MKKIVTLLSFLFVLSSCHEYSKQICTEEFLEDIPNLEGEYQLELQGEQLSMAFKRISQGVYQHYSDSEENKRVRSCRVGETFFLEDFEEGNYSLFRVTDLSPNMLVEILSFDTEKLDEANIPYVVRAESDEMDAPLIFVDNTFVDKTQLVSALKRLYPMLLFRKTL
jgi:hypothetical protein